MSDCHVPILRDSQGQFSVVEARGIVIDFLIGDTMKVKVWYDSEGDFLEVIFKQKEGYFREASFDQVMEKVDMKGNVIGFSVLKVSSLKEKILDVDLANTSK